VKKSFPSKIIGIN